jgi:hypothetical protein
VALVPKLGAIARMPKREPNTSTSHKLERYWYASHTNKPVNQRRRERVHFWYVPWLKYYHPPPHRRKKR